MKTRALVLVLLPLVACAVEEAPPAPSEVRLAVATPGSYGPAFAEPGFSDKNSYFAAGFQATVNHYGGNLMVSATDAELPSQGLFGLRFSRSYNSNAVQLQNQTVAGESDGPLGQGWIGHFGLLWTAAPTVFRPQFIDGTGARHLFYPHTVLNGVLAIASPNSNPTYISARLEILRWIDADHWELYTPEGVRYELTRLAQYGFLVPTRISDSHGNTWSIGYEPDAFPYFQHPLPSSIEDGLGRKLTFTYVTRSGKRRLDKVSFGSTTLATYSYTASGGHDFLWKHTTGEGRVTEYTSDTGPYPRLGTITAILAPTGGLTQIQYGIKNVFYRAGQPQTVYAVTQVQRGGYTWTYDYLNASSSAPANDEWRVRVTTTGFTGEYTYYTYGSAAVCNGNLWKVGMLLRSDETFGGATQSKTYDYARFHVANATGTDICDLTVGAPRKVSESTVQDGFTLATTYSAHDSLNFAHRIDGPGGVGHDLDYQHVVVGGAAPKLLLGLEKNRAVRVGTALVERTEHNFASNALVPSWVRFYRTPTSYVQAALVFWTTNGVAGALRSKTYGGYSESYDYQNGVVSLVNYPTGPDLARTVNPIGTIARETRDGVTRGYTWDKDFRPTVIDQPAPDADSTIAYTATRATVTTGTGELRLTYDTWGRMTERREKIASMQYATDAFAAFNPFGRATRETPRTGATYDIAYDAFGRLLRRSAPGDAHVYTYATDATGALQTETHNATVVRERKHDHLGRLSRGSTNGRRIDHVFAVAANGVTETITPQALPARTIRRDFLGNKLEETHPETGRIVYQYTAAEAWPSGVNRPGIDYTYTLDTRGRITEVKVGGTPISTRRYHPTFGSVDRTEQAGVVIEHRDHDVIGRPRTVITTIPRALPPPLLRSPNVHQMTLPAPGDPNYFPYFTWDPAEGAAQYDYELWEHDRTTRTRRRLARSSTPGLKLYWPDLGFVPSIAANLSYSFRVRSRSAASGEVSPYAPAASFAFGTNSPPDPPPTVPDEAMPPPPNWQDLPPAYPPPIKVPVVLTTQLEYDANGRIARVRHPDLDVCRAGSKRERWQDFTYNALGGSNMVSLDGIPFVKQTTYWDSGLPRVADVDLYINELIALTAGRYVPRGRVYVRHTYDTLGRLTEHKIDNGERTYYRAHGLQYNDWGFVSGFTRTDPGLSAAVSYGYDTLGRMERFTIGGQTVNLSYDGAGNLTGHNALALTGLSLYGPGNVAQPARLDLAALPAVSYGSNNRRAAWTYDADGRVTGDDDWQYGYDSLDQLTAVRDGSWIEAQYLNDADGNRVRDVHGSTVAYTVRLPDGRVITIETQRYFRLRRTTSGVTDDFLVCAPSLAHDLVWHNGEAIVEAIQHDYEWVWQTELEFAFRDRLGTPALLMSSFDAATEPELRLKYYEHAPYGQQMRSELWNRYTSLEFTGHEYDSLVDRHYMRARYYDASYGRFLRPNPAFDFNPTNPSSYNLYGYARSNPVSFTDPSGREADACPVQLCQRPAELPGGSIMDFFGFRHWWLKTPNLETGMGKAGGGVPGLATTDNPYTLMTTMNDHSGQSEAPESQCQPVCGVSLSSVESLAKVGKPTGVWIPLVNDCNNTIDDILKKSGGDPANWPSPPLHFEFVHNAYLGAEEAVRSFGMWVNMQLYWTPMAPWGGMRSR